MKWLLYLLIAIISFCLGWFVTPGRKDNPDRTNDTIIKTNTVREVETDTQYIFSPQPYIAWIDKSDTIYASDSCWHQREYKVYKDSDYYVKISGIGPRLDEIRFYPRTIREYIYTDRQITGKKKRFGVGISAGYGLSSKGMVPYIGISVNYNIFQW